MGRHRRVKVVLGARSTVVKAAAAMGVATALAAGINSAANGPVATQATADTNDGPVAHLAGSTAPETGHSSTAQKQESVPTGFATESAGQPKLIQQAWPSPARTTDTSAPAPAPSASQPASQTPGSSQPSAPGAGSSTPGSGSTSTQAPAPTQNPGGAQGGQQGGGLLGTVVGTVGGVVGGLLG